MGNLVSCPGLFVVGTDTGVGKTYVAARIATALHRIARKVGVYKPAASGCRQIDGELVSDDAVALWEAAGKPGTLDAVCLQRFTAPLAPHLAAREEGKELNPTLLRRGLEFWQRTSEIIIVEGAGGLMSPLGDHEYVADLAAGFRFPLIVVVPNRIGAINSALTTLIAAAARPKPLSVAGIVLNDLLPPSSDDPSTSSNRRELEKRCDVPILAQLCFEAERFDAAIDWMALAIHE
ncbi:MAG TPA: dethiobiotin synthase [Pirellulaceae bacterium]|jgi:dethiobiotin synthetase